MRLIPQIFAAILVVGLMAAPHRISGAASALGTLPPGWTASLQLGMSSGPGDAAAVRATAPFAIRSQYLSGGVNTGGGWATWNAGGAFVTSYATESTGAGMRSVFDYYMLLQSLPASGGTEAAKISSNLNNAATMAAYYTDLKLFFTRSAPFGPSVILHVEPDLWGYLEQAASNNDAATVPTKVAASGVADLAGLPDTAAGFAQAILRLRDRYAPGVQLGYHLSVWGTGNDILYTKPADTTVDSLAATAATFYGSLGANFDLAFADPSDRDAAFKQVQYGDGGAAWWSATDYARNVRFVAGFSNATGRRIVLWQTPLGNTQMRAMNNTWDHYQDNHVEWFLDDATRAHLSSYAAAGVIAIIFGRGADGATCACDAAADGVTDPAPINGNLMQSINADDDGGFFRAKAGNYYAAGPLPLPNAVAAPTPTPLPSAPPGPCAALVGPGIAPPVGVPQGLPGLHAAWYGQSGYPTLCAGSGQTSTATVAFYNSGSIGWVSGRLGEVAYLGTWAPEPGQDQPSTLGGDGQLGSPNTGWPRYNRIAIQPATYVGPGQVAWFRFTIRAPQSPGVYRLYLRPLIEGASWLEDYGVFWVVTVR